MGTSAHFAGRTFDDLLLRYGGDWMKVIEHVKVKQRLILSEKDLAGDWDVSA